MAQTGRAAGKAIIVSGGATCEHGIQFRLAKPEEIGQAILYLVSDESRYVTGTEIIIDGGFTA